MPIVVDQPLLPGVNGVQLRHLFLNDAANPADLAAFKYTGDTVGAATVLQADVRQLAGRRRIIRRAGARAYTGFSLTLPWVDATQARWLVEHIGRLVCFRDHAGSKVYGVYLEVPAEIFSSYCSSGTRLVQRQRFADVKLTVDEVDHNEVV